MNGNGDTADERPMSFVYNNWQGNQCDLYGMFGLNDNLEHRVVVDGKVTYTVADPRFKDATNFIADWVTKGLIDKVSFEQSQDNFLANGKGMETYGAFYWWESETVVSNPENYIVCNPLVGPNGEQTVCVSNSPEISTGEVVIFSECPNVEVLLAYLDRYYDPVISAQINYGPIGIVYEEERDANGMLVQKPVPVGVLRYRPGRADCGSLRHPHRHQADRGCGGLQAVRFLRRQARGQQGLDRQHRGECLRHRRAETGHLRI